MSYLADKWIVNTKLRKNSLKMFVMCKIFSKKLETVHISSTYAQGVVSFEHNIEASYFK